MHLLLKILIFAYLYLFILPQAYSFYQTINIILFFIYIIITEQRILKNMEDYVLIDSVLQALHMSKPTNSIKHLKKYEIQDNHLLTHTHNHSLCSETPKILQQTKRYSTRPKLVTRNEDMAAIEQVEKKKFKMKGILNNEQKICQNEHNQHIQTHFSDFFVKKQIHPRFYREHSPRNTKLYKSPQTKPAPFYDINLSFIRKKSRACVILPQRKYKNKKYDSRSSFQKSSPQININQLVKKQLEDQKRLRKIQCKTASGFGCHNDFLKQTKKIQQQLRNKENQQKTLKSAVSQRFQKYEHFQLLSKNLLPLNKDEIKSKTNALMQKYNIDSTRCCFKVTGN